MNGITNYLCAIYSNNNDCPVSGLSDLKIIGAALAGIALVGVAYASLCRKKDPQMIKFFEDRLKLNPTGDRYIGMNGFFTKGDTAILKQLFETWRLQSGFCLFDILGADIYRNWKVSGGNPVYLTRFCELCDQLSKLIMTRVLYPQTDIHPLFTHLHGEFKALSRMKMRRELQEKFQLLLKVISSPEKTEVLGRNSLQLFEHSEKLDQGSASEQDIRDFLEFSAQKNSYYRSFMNCESAINLSKKLNRFISKAQKTKTQDLTERTKLGDQVVFSYELVELRDRIDFSYRLKETVDYRLLNMKIPLFRMYNNACHLHDFDSSIYKDWFVRKYSEFVDPKFCNEIKNLLKTDGSIYSEDKISKDFSLLANRMHFTGALTTLEALIIEKLKEAASKEISEEEYANLFANMTRLYQIVHDLRYVREPNQDQLGDRDFPESFANLSCLPSKEEPIVAPPPLPSLPPIKPPSVSHEITPTPASKPAKKKKTTDEYEHKQEERLISASIHPESKAPISAMEQPYFPEKNANPREVIKILLSKGFVIERVSGGHYQMKHVTTNVPTSVPYHGKRNISPGTLHSIRGAFYASQGFIPIIT